MQLYIKPELETKLRQQGNMSGLVNDLLADYFGTEKNTNVGPPKAAKSETPTVPPRTGLETLGAPIEPPTPPMSYVPPVQKSQPTRKRVVRKLPQHRRSDLI